MTDLYWSEGFEYSRIHLVSDLGCIEDHERFERFALHVDMEWEEVLTCLQEQWGYGQFWQSPRKLKRTKLKDGRNNFVFEISRTF